MNATLYEILEVAPDASPEQIKSSYRALAKQWHPDCHPEQAAKIAAHQRMQAMNLAYQTLKDPARRHFYDAQLRAKGLRRTRVRPVVPGRRASPQVRHAALTLARSYFEGLINKHPNCATAVEGALRIELGRRQRFVARLVAQGHDESLALDEWLAHMKRIAATMDSDTPR